MTLINLIEDIQELKEPKKISLVGKMKEFYGVIARYERDGEIHRDDRAKIETLKDFIQDMVKQDDRRNGE